MADEPITSWQGATVVDDAPRTRRPWSLIAGAFVVLLAIDAALAFALPERAAPPTGFDGAASARGELRAAARAEDAWLLVGDSVLAGDVMAGKVEGWQRERLVDHMQRELAADSPALFQVALDGLLPVDLLQVVRALDRVDPGGDVGLVIELNPRFFSREYAAATACTRPWLCELGPALIEGDGSVRWDSLVIGALTNLRDAVARVVPVYRHRDKIAAWDQPEVLRGREAGDDPLSGRARLLEHYRAPALGEESVQVAALVEVVRRVRALGRRAVFFTTPIEDGFLAQARGELKDGAYAATLSRIIEGDGAGDETSGDVVLVPLDHPAFHGALFLDHCHLTPEGNRTLAINLLHTMGLPLRERPRSEELVHAEDVDRTLVGRAAQGYADGPAWQALFGPQPQGVAVAPGGRRIVVADTSNHTLRELTGDLYVVRTLAGVVDEPGSADGPVSEARLRSPRAPWIRGDDVYFADQDGTQLRWVHGGVVSTIELPEVRWSRIDQILGHAADLLILDAGRRVVRVNVTTRATRVIARAQGSTRIAAIASAPDGRVWLAQSSGQIWQGRTGAPMVIGANPVGASLVFANKAKQYLPQKRGKLFPLSFAEVRLDRPFALQYIARYDTLLVADDAKPKETVVGFTERTQLRMLSLTDRRVYPWIFSQVHAMATYVNRPAGSFAGPLHVGSVALDPESASLVVLERDRSRLLWLSDGVWATARSSHTANFSHGGFREVFGNEAGIRTQDRFRPDLYLPRRVERVPRRGPFTGLVVSSSMSAMSQSMGPYSLVRRLERHLQAELGTRDGIRFELVHRAYSQPPIDRIVDAVDLYTAQSGRPDVILMEVHDFRGRFFPREVEDAAIRGWLQQMQAYADRSAALLVLFDNSGLIATAHDGLRAAPPVVERAKAIARQMDIAVIELTDELLPRSLHEGVWGSPPMKGSHGNPYAIDATAALLAERLYPRIAAHLAGREPAIFSAPVIEEVDPATTLAGAFAEGEVDWAAILPDVPGLAIQRAREADEVALFVDLKVAVGERRAVEAAELERLAIGCLYGALVRDGSYADATRATVRLAWFDRYDEYGLGVQGGAEVALRRTFDRPALVTALASVRAAE